MVDRGAPVLMDVELSAGKAVAWWCPGCQGLHAVPLEGARPWLLSGPPTEPTLTPNVIWKEEERLPRKGKAPPERCHSTMTRGVLIFHDDCTHLLAGQRVPMEPVDG